MNVECVLRGGKWKCYEKNLSLCQFPTTDSAWTCVEFNPGLRGERPAANRQSQGTFCNGVKVRSISVASCVCWALTVFRNVNQPDSETLRISFRCALKLQALNIKR
jgi:hypothetical protein